MNQLQGHAITYRIAKGPHQGRKVFTLQFESTAAASGKRVLIICAGPTSLSAAFHLTRSGHEVEVRDAVPHAGGMIHFDIPVYRMPRTCSMPRDRSLPEIGVTITLVHRVDDNEAEIHEGRFGAAFVAFGDHLSKRVDIPA